MGWLHTQKSNFWSVPGQTKGGAKWILGNALRLQRPTICRWCFGGASWQSWGECQDVSRTLPVNFIDKSNKSKQFPQNVFCYETSLHPHLPVKQANMFWKQLLGRRAEGKDCWFGNCIFDGMTQNSQLTVGDLFCGRNCIVILDCCIGLLTGQNCQYDEETNDR